MIRAPFSNSANGTTTAAHSAPSVATLMNIRILSIRATILSSALFLCAGASFSAPGQRDDLSAEDIARVRAVTAPAADFSKAEPFERMSAGAATSLATVDGNAFSHFSANLDFEGEQDFKLGNGLFRKVWVSSPSSTQASDGLGPLYNARSCQRCHLKDGRGHPPENAEDDATSMLIRLAVPARTEEQRRALENRTLLRVPDPVYGGQLQDVAVAGVPAEGRIRVSYSEETVSLNGGETVSLRRPTFSVTNLGYGPMDDDVTLSPRIAPPMIGLGLIEAIHEDDILAQVDADDADGDGISGRASWFRPAEGENVLLGRFGWKASNPSVLVQSADAFNGDLGISSPLFPNPHGDCTPAQKPCMDAPTGVQERLGRTEAPDPVLDLVAFYARNLAVPARREVDNPQVLRGKEIFYESQCIACHTPKYVTRRDAEQEELQFQLIWPYTDLLLHDMGPGLADNQAVGDANGQEWRTPPLWGIGLTKEVNGHTYFLHDGRARNLLEAVMWHGGEAEASRDAVAALEPEDRSALLKFLESL